MLTDEHKDSDHLLDRFPGTPTRHFFGLISSKFEARLPATSCFLLID